MLLIQLTINGLIYGILLSLISIGFGIVYRTTGIFHIAYGGMYIFSSYLVYFLIVNLHLGQVLSVILAIIFTISLGISMEKFVYLPFYKKSASEGVVLIVSLGMYIIIENIIALLFGSDVKAINLGTFPKIKIIGLLYITKMQLIQFTVGISILLFFYLLLTKSRLFKTLWAMGDEPELIAVLGLPLFKLRSMVFITSSLFVSVASSLFSLDIGMDPHIGLSNFLIAAVSVFVGGLDNVWGWVIGALVLSEIQTLAMWKFSARWNDLITFFLLIIILLIKPQGILSISKRLEET